MNSCQYCRSTNQIKKGNTFNKTLGFDICLACTNLLNEKRPTQQIPTIKAVIYLRVSTKQQNNDDDSGLFIQMRQCIEYCFDNNIQCLDIYQDIHSAFKMRNTGLKGLRNMIYDLGFDIYLPNKTNKNKTIQKLNNAIKNSQQLLIIPHHEEQIVVANHIIVANIDRFGRDLINMLALKCQLAQYGTSIISASKIFKTGNDLGEMAFCREALEAEMFSRDRSHRIKQVKSAKKQMGHFMGGNPKYGFMTQKINNIRKVVNNPTEQKIIQHIKSLYSKYGNKKAYLMIQREKTLNRGKPWTKNGFNRIVKLPESDDMEVDD